MSKYTDKLQEWVNSVKMCEAAGIEPCFMYGGDFYDSYELYPQSNNLLDYEFPIAVIEGKPVFVGDKPWFIGNGPVQARRIEIAGFDGELFIATDGGRFRSKYLSWNPPKSKTVMVEITVEDARILCNPSQFRWQNNLAISCRKALKEME